MSSSTDSSTADRERLEFVVRTTGLGIWLNPLPLGELVWNDNVKAHFHLPPDARVDIDLFYSRIHPDDREATRRAVDAAITDRSTFDIVYRTVSPAGDQKWIRAVGHASYGPGGQPTKFDGITLDVTSQVAAEQRLRQFADTAPAMLWVTEPDGRCSFLSRGWSEFTGQAEAQGLGFGWLEMVHPDDRAATGDAFVQANAGRQPFALEHRLRRSDGHWHWVIDAGSPRWGASGEFQGYVGSVTDIHARRSAEDSLRQSEQRLRQSEERYRAFVANSSEGIWRMEFQPPVDTRLPVPQQVDLILRHGRFAECNEAFARMYGQDSPQSLLGQGLAVMMDPADPAVRAYLATLVEAGYKASGVESQEHDREGRPVWFDNSISGVVEDGLLVRAWGTQRNVTDRKRAELALRDADRRKDEFLATLAHELRNPLAPIRSAVEVMRLRDPGDVQTRAQRELIDRQVKHLARLMDDLMDVSRITRNKLELRAERLVFQDVVRAAVENARPELDGGAHPLSLDLPEAPLRVRGDEVRLVQVVQNLVSNAAKYSAPGAPVMVSVASEHGQLRLSVRDQGQGIGPADLERVFELFYQAESGTRRSHGGLGIGLSLVRQLAELHGGRTQARSAGLGQGSEFLVWLPLEGAEAAAAAGPAPAAWSLGRSRRILVVDDNADSADTLAEVLRLLGHEAHTAYDGEAAVRQVQAVAPDTVVMDLGMPRMDGLQACRAIRALSQGQALRVLAVSGWGQSADVLRSTEAGFDGHLVKPVAPDALLAELERLDALRRSPSLPQG